MTDYITLIQRLKDHYESPQQLQNDLFNLPDSLPSDVLSQLADLMLNDPYMADDLDANPAFERVGTVYPIRDIIANTLYRKYRTAIALDVWLNGILNDSNWVVDTAINMLKPQLDHLNISTHPQQSAIAELGLRWLNDDKHGLTAISLLGCVYDLPFLRTLGFAPIWDDWGGSTGGWGDDSWGWHDTNASSVERQALYSAFKEFEGWHKILADQDHPLKGHTPTILSTLLRLSADETLANSVAKWLKTLEGEKFIQWLYKYLPTHAYRAVVRQLLGDTTYYETLILYCVDNPLLEEKIADIQTGLRNIKKGEDAESLMAFLSHDNYLVRQFVATLFPLAQFNKADAVTLILKHITETNYPESYDATITQIIRHGEMDFSLAFFSWIKVLDEQPTKQAILYRIAQKSFDNATLVGGLVLAQSDSATQFTSHQLERVLDELDLGATIRNYFIRDYHKQINEIWADSKKTWETSVGSAKANYIILMVMSVTIFIIGIFLLILPINLLQANQEAQLSTLLGAGTSLITGLGLIVTLFYGGTFKNINNVVNRLNRTHAAFVGFMLRIAQISIIFEQDYTYRKLDSTNLNTLSTLLDDATNDITQTLLTNEERKTSHDLATDIENQYTELLKQKLGITS